MTDAHCHLSENNPSIRELLIGRDFAGVHPWEMLSADCTFEGVKARLGELRRRLQAEPGLGVGEIGLDRLKDRTISALMRTVFEEQLKLAIEFHRPVVLHGAKCWGQVVQTVAALSNGDDGASAFLFHGFSRSDGLIPDIVRLRGYISVGPAVLNDHAVNYRKLVQRIPLDRLLVETDRTAENAGECPSIFEVAAKVAELRGLSVSELESVTDANANVFRI